MKTPIARGWRSVKEQTYILILLFVYRLLWGYFLYSFVRDAVYPFLLRIRENADSTAKLLYYIEAQFSLLKNAEVRTWLWTLAAMVLLRMLVSPLIRAGLLYELQQESLGNRGLFLFPGMKRYGWPVFLFSLAEWGLTLLPFCWLGPKLYTLTTASYLQPALLLTAAAYAAGWALYAYIIRQCFLYMQFGYVHNRSIAAALMTYFKNIVPATGLSLLLGAGGVFSHLLALLIGWLWPGLPALLARQAAPFPATLFKLWGIAAQYHLWSSKQRN